MIPTAPLPGQGSQWIKLRPGLQCRCSSIITTADPGVGITDLARMIVTVNCGVDLPLPHAFKVRGVCQGRCFERNEYLLLAGCARSGGGRLSGVFGWDLGAFSVKVRSRLWRAAPRQGLAQGAGYHERDCAGAVTGVRCAGEGILSKRSYKRVARALFMELCRVYLTRKASLSHLGRTLVCVRVSAISHNNKRLAVRMSQDRRQQRRFEDNGAPISVTRSHIFLLTKNSSCS